MYNFNFTDHQIIFVLDGLIDMELKILIWSCLVISVQGIKKCNDSLSQGIEFPEPEDSNWDLVIHYKNNGSVTRNIPESCFDKTSLNVWFRNYTVDDIGLLFGEGNSLSHLKSSITKVRFEGIVGTTSVLKGFPKQIPKYLGHVTDFEISNFAIFAENATNSAVEDQTQFTPVVLNSLRLRCFKNQNFQLSHLTGINITSTLVLRDCLNHAWQINQPKKDRPFRYVSQLNIYGGRLNLTGIRKIMNTFPRLKTLQIKNVFLDSNDAKLTEMLKALNSHINVSTTFENVRNQKKICDEIKNKTECSEFYELRLIQRPLRSLVARCKEFKDKERECRLKSIHISLAISIPVTIITITIVIVIILKKKATLYTKKCFANCPSLHNLIFRILQKRIPEKDNKRHEILLVSHKSRWCSCNNIVSDDENEAIANELTRMLKKVQPETGPNRNFVRWSYQASDENKILTRENDGIVGKDMKEELKRLCDISKRCVVILSRNYFHLHSKEFKTIASKFDTKHLRKRWYSTSYDFCLCN